MPSEELFALLFIDLPDSLEDVAAHMRDGILVFVFVRMDSAVEVGSDESVFGVSAWACKSAEDDAERLLICRERGEQLHGPGGIGDVSEGLDDSCGGDGISDWDAVDLDFLYHGKIKMEEFFSAEWKTVYFQRDFRRGAITSSLWSN